MIREVESMLKEYFTTRYKQQVLSFKYLSSEVDPSLNQWLEGSLDLVLWSEKHKCIIDVKSKKAKYSSYRNSDWEEYNDKFARLSSVTPIGDSGTSFYVEDLKLFIEEIRDPFLAANFYQLNLYACNPFIVERGIDHAAIIQYNKNTSELREIRFKPSKELYDQIVHKFQKVIEVVAARDPEAAQKDFSLGSMKCAFCSFNKRCWADEDPLKKWFKTLPPKNWPKDVDRLSDALYSDLTDLYNKFKKSTEEASTLQLIEQQIIEIMTQQGIKKIRFEDGDVYELKYLKSPREHIELRRSKT
jgi:CRISPR/Cas system-associated exonuclease Cas4 (RecB family)